MERELGALSRIGPEEVEELLRIEQVQVLLLRKELESKTGIDRSVDARRKVVEQRGDRVKLDRMPPVRCRDECSLSNPKHFLEKSSLLLARTCMFNDSIAKH